MALQFSQFPNGSFPALSRPLRSFVARVAPVEPPIPPTPPQFGGGAIHALPLDRNRRTASTRNKIADDDMEIMLISIAILSSHIWRN